jgi:hypothetical protein
MEEDELEAARIKAAAERRDHGRRRIRPRQILPGYALSSLGYNYTENMNVH